MNHSLLRSLSGLALALGVSGATHAATFTVTSANDAGLGSLRQALADAAATPGSHTIRFDNSVSTITLTSAELQITSDVTIDGDRNGDGAPDITISGANAFRVLALANGITVELNGLIIQDGAAFGGGAGISVGSSSSTLTLRNSVVQNNQEQGLGGGGIYGTSVTVNVVSSLIRNNTSNSFGGGIRVVGTGILDIRNSTIMNNTTNGASAHGGGVQYAGSSLRIVNSTFSGNAALGADSVGGGLRITNGVSEIIQATFVGNAASDGGGGVSSSVSTDTFINTVVAGNTSGAGAMPAVAGNALATGGSADDVSGTIESATGSYFGSNVTITNNQGSFNNQGTAGLALGNLGNNGGAQPTHLPAITSALRDAVACDASPLASADQRGISRPQGTQCDIGAVEIESVLVNVAVTGSGRVDSAPAGIVNCRSASGACSLSTAVGDPAITLTATADASHSFVQWGGACAGAGTASTCNLTAGTAQNATALFTRASATQTTAGGTVNLQISGSSCVFTTTTNGGAPMPAGYALPYGQIGFQATGCAAGGSTTVTLTFPGPVPAGAMLLKYTGSGWALWPSIPAGANALSFTVTDAQAAGSTGAATGDLNATPGVIDDPVALAVPVNSTAIPTLQTWALLLTSLLALLGGGWHLRRRQQGLPPR